jgi:hypothetical protein
MLKRLEGDEWKSKTARERGIELSRAIPDREVTYNLVEGPRGYAAKQRSLYAAKITARPDFLWSTEHQRE